MTWLDDVYARHVAGDHPGELYQLYEQHRAAEDRPKPVPKQHRILARAWDAKDWDVLEAGGWLTDDKIHLTSEATRILMSVWDEDDKASR